MREALGVVTPKTEAGVGAQECGSGAGGRQQAGTRVEASLRIGSPSRRCSLCFLLSTQMKKVMLTVFKHNHGAYQFFREALQ